MEAAQTRFFARAVADPLAVGDLWSASLNPSNSEEDWVEEWGRDWRDPVSVLPVSSTYCMPTT